MRRLSTLFLFCCVALTFRPIQAQRGSTPQSPTQPILEFAENHLEQAVAAKDWSALAELPLVAQYQIARSWRIDQPDVVQTAPVALTVDEQARLEAMHSAELSRAEREIALSQAAQVVPPSNEPSSFGNASHRTAATLTVGSLCTFKTLQDALAAAQAGDIILLASGTYQGNFNLTQSVSIYGGYNPACRFSLGGQSTIQGNSADSVFEITNSSTTVTLSGLNITDGRDDNNYGGGIEIDDATVTLRNVTVQRNASEYGGGLHISDAVVTLEAGTLVHSNTADVHGGGIYCQNSQITVTDNSAIGVELLAAGGVTAYPNSADANNSNVGSGGGAYLDNCTLDLDATDGSFITIGYNTARSGAGVYALNNSRVNLKGSGVSITNNEAETYGGGMYVTSGTDVFGDNASVIHNSSTIGGAGIYGSGSGTLIDFDRNTSTPCSNTRCAEIAYNSVPSGTGGGVMLFQEAKLDLEGVYLDHNRASGASALYARNTNTHIELDSVMMTDNVSTSSTLYMRESSEDGFGTKATLNNVTIAGNTGNSSALMIIQPRTAIEVNASIIAQNDGAMASGTGELIIGCSVLSEAYGGGNIVDDPLFVGNGNYHITRQSPARDLCNSGFATDIDLQNRPIDTPRRILNQETPSTRTLSNISRAVRVEHDHIHDKTQWLIDNSVRAVDYGTFLWLELTEAQFDQLNASDVRFTEALDYGTVAFDERTVDVTALANTRQQPMLTKENAGLYFVQMRSPINGELLDEVRQYGEPIQYYGGFTYLVWADAERLARMEQSDNLRAVVPFSAEFRTSQRLDQHTDTVRNLVEPERLAVTALLYDDGQLKRTKDTLPTQTAIMAEFERHVMGEVGRMVVWELLLMPDDLPYIQSIPQLINLDRIYPDQLDDERSNQIIADNVDVFGNVQTGYANWLTATGYDGTGVTVAVVDSGVDWDHPDLNVVSGTEYGGYSETNEPGSDGGTTANATGGSGHDTHVAGIVAGDGGSGSSDSANFIYGQGVAPGATIHAMDAIASDVSVPVDHHFDTNNTGYSGTGSWGYYFNSTDGRWATGGSGNYNNNESSTLTSPNINLSGFDDQFEQPELFWREFYTLADNGDCFVVQASNNGGSSWATIQSTICGGSNDWTWKSWTVPDNFLVNNFRLRYQFTSNSSGTDDGVTVRWVQLLAQVGVDERIRSAAGNADLSNNSWNIGPAGAGYTQRASTHDDLALDALSTSGRTPFLTIFSAGNAGNQNGNLAGSGCGTGACLDSITEPKEAKNMITVGSSTSERSTAALDNMVGSSSRGPSVNLAVSNLIQPDVVAPGDSIISTENGDGQTLSCANSPSGTTQHAWCGGTSMASPHVAGAAALFTQYWHVRNGAHMNPEPATVKAALIATTDDLGGASDGWTGTIGNRPNEHQGWGRININRLLNPTVPILFYENPVLIQDIGQFYDLTIQANDTNEPLRITLAWSDAPGAAGAANPLVNDLRIYVTDPNGDTWAGNNFGNDGWSIPSSDVNDVHNPVENVWIENPMAGEYSIRILSPDLGGDGYYYNGDATDQHFSLVCYNCDDMTRGTYDAGADEAIHFIGINGASCNFASISDALAAATNDDTLLIQSGSYAERLGIINKPLTLSVGTGDCSESSSRASDIVEIDGGNLFTARGGLFEVTGGATVTMTNMTLKNARAQYGGIAYVNVNAKLVLDNVDIFDGEASDVGGGLRVYGGSAELHNGSQIYSSRTTGTDAADGGGGVAITNNGSIKLYDSYIGSPVLFNANSSATNGGGLLLDGGQADLFGTSALSANGASNNGGGAYITNGAALHLHDNARVGTHCATTIFCFSNSASYGGGVFVSGSNSKLIADGGLLTDNSATDDGAGIYATVNATVALTGTTIFNNQAEGQGGGLFVSNSSHATLVNVNGSENSADSQGGFAAFYNSSNLKLQTDYTLCNPATLAANVYCTSIRANVSADHGGALYFDDSSAQIRGTVLQDNSAGSSEFGGAIYIGNASDIELYDSLVIGNNRSAIELNNGLFTSKHVTYSENNGNEPLFANAGASLIFDNNIVWGNANPIELIDGLSLSAKCNITQGNALTGTDNLSVDPKFETTLRGKYRLATDSPAIDACTTGHPTDLDGASRGTTYDMGAFERNIGVPTAVAVQENGVTTSPVALILVLFGLLLLGSLRLRRQL